MMKYVAFLRGINVNGVKIKMADLKADFEAHGFEEVHTVLATGNVIFSAQTAAPDLSFLPVKAFIKTVDEVCSLLVANPLPAKEGFHTYVFVAEADFAEVALAEFEKSKTPEEDGCVSDGIFYWQVPIGQTLDTPFSRILGKKAYQARLTSRNINTIERIIKKLWKHL